MERFSINERLRSLNFIHKFIVFITLSLIVRTYFGKFERLRKWILISFLLSGLFGFSQITNYLFHVDSAIKHYRQELTASIQKNDSAEVIEKGLLLVRAYFTKPYLDSAGLFINELDKYTGKNKYRFYRILSAKADLEKYKGKNASSLEKYLEVLRYFEKTNNTEYVFKAHTDLAEFYRKTFNFSLAKHHVYRALEIIGRVHDTTKIIRFYNRAAAVFNESSGKDSSVLFSRKTMELAKKADNFYALGAAYNEIGYAYTRKTPDSALTYYKLALETFKKIGATREHISALQNYLENYLDPNNVAQSRKYKIDKYKEIIEIVKNQKLEILLSRLYHDISMEYYALGDSLNYYRYKSISRKEVYDEMLKENASKISEIREKYENEKLLSEIKSTQENLEQNRKDLKTKNKLNIIYLTLLLLTCSLLFILIYFIKFRNRVNKELSLKVKEQQVLIQEVHHRVKNNLQFINSLINMQISAQSGKEDTKSLQESARRIKSMALVHEMLYTGGNQSHLNIGQYLQELVNTLQDMINTENKPVQFSLKVYETPFNPADAIAIGIITSELVSNSIKYAFENIPDPKINIVLSQKNKQQMEFIYEDNGKGLSESSLGTKKLGMRLIDIFSRQLKGTFSFNSENAFRFILTFKTETINE